MQQITTTLWYEDAAEAAARHYVSIFESAEILDIQRFGEGVPGHAGLVMAVRFRLGEQEFLALNGASDVRFNAAVSLAVSCATQEEVDRLWARLSEGGEPGRCGWLKDRFGVSWQVVPAELPALLREPDPARAQRVIAALMEMGRIDLATLRAAAEGESKPAAAMV